MLDFVRKNKTALGITLLWVVIFVGVFFRSYKADLFPIDNNDDGLYYVWTGNSFLANPLQLTSHTIFDTKNEALLWRSQYHDFIPHERFGMKIVQPWFDHPPFGTILISLPAHLLGYTQLEQIPQLIVRMPALIASIFTLLFTFLIARKLFSQQIAFAALLFLALTPYFVFAHRQSYLENILTPIFLSSILFYLSYTESKKKYFLILSAATAFLCGWIKIPAFAVPAMFLGWSMYRKDWLATKLFLGTAVVSVASYIGYGLLSDTHFFLGTITNQGVRGMYLSSFIDSFVKPGFYGSFMDGSYILGLLFCLMIAVKKNKTEQEKFFSWLFIAWLLVLFLTSGEYNNSAWYKYPLIPFMSIGLGVFAAELWNTLSIYLYIPFLLYGLSGYDLAKFPISSQVLRIAVLAITIPFFLYLCFPKNRQVYLVARLAVISLFIAIIVGNILAIQRYPVQRCLEEPCLQPNKIILQQN